MKDNIRVAVAAFFGTATPAASGFFSNVEPLLRALLTVGQLGVAVVTILYIYRKWKNARGTKK